jgi:GNAT superfamily N-acetyltransferase
MKPGLPQQQRLRDGAIVTLRYIRPEDAPELARGFQELSLASRRQRFFAGLATLGEPMLHYLTEVDGYNHVAIVATTPDRSGRPRGIGVARFIRLPSEPTIAEPAITVSDPYQGRGVGSLLAHALAEAAVERGVTRFRGPILEDNWQVHRLLEDFGAELHHAEDGLVFDVALAGPRSVLERAHVGDQPVDLIRP